MTTTVSVAGGDTRRRRGLALLVDTWRAERLLLAVAVGGGIVWQLVGVAVPLVLGATVERGIVGRDPAAAWSGAVAILALGSVEAGADALRHSAETRASARAIARLRERIAGAAVAFDPPARDLWPAGQLVARATSDADTVAGSVEAVGYTVAYLLAIPLIVGLLVGLDPVLAVAVVVAVGCSVLLTWRSSSVWERREAAAQEALADSIAEAEAALEGWKVIRGIGAEAGVVTRFTDRSARAAAATSRVTRLSITFEPVLGLLSAASAVVVLWLGGNRVIDATMTVGDLVAAVGLALFLVTPARAAGDAVVLVQRTSASTVRLAEVLDSVPAAPPATPPAASAGATLVAAHDVSFAYPARPERPVFEHVSLAVGRGELLVLDGPVGAGKSTLAAVLAGARAATAGTVERGGTALRLGPEPFLFAQPIADNLRLGAPDATDAELADALGIADADEFVGHLPDGMRSVLADRGASLSGGQRQRLAIARAVLARPDVLVLDGTTSALEPHRELALLARLGDAWSQGALIVVSSTPGVRDLADATVELGAPGWHGAGRPEPAE